MAAENIGIEDFDQKVLQSETPVLVDFWADWCGPCKVLKPVVDQVADEAEGFSVYSINADGAKDLTDRFNIYSLPCLLVFRNGRVVKKSIGFKSKDHILDMIEDSAE